MPPEPNPSEAANRANPGARPKTVVPPTVGNIAFGPAVTPLPEPIYPAALLRRIAALEQRVADLERAVGAPLQSPPGDQP